ncbi:MAG: metallophosphoesterase [Bacteroidota bacterium]
MNLSRVYFIPFLLLTIIQSCANYRMHISDADNDWQNQTLPTQEIVHQFYLIGDAGGTEYDKELPALKLLKEELENAVSPKNSTVIYLGDNIYENGLPPAGDALSEVERKLDEFKLAAQADLVKDFEGNVFFIAGNHDWYGYGLEGVKAQRKFLEKYLDREDIFLPKPGCGDPQEIELTDDLVLILLDSQWWLENWDKEPRINNGCEVQSRYEFQLAFDELVRSNRTKNIIVALHHPMYTYGPHNGGYNLKDHLFPLTKVSKNLYIPLPIIGSIYPGYRSVIGTRQDVPHPLYKDLRSILVNSAQKNGSFIFVSGHEHSLQYITKKDQTFIVSGSGTKESVTRLGDGSSFAYSGNGFVRLDVYEDGTIWSTYLAYVDGEPKVVFRKKVNGPLPQSTYKSADYPEYTNMSDSISLPISNFNYEKKGMGKMLWGEHYRKAYKTEITVPKFDLESFQGGVKVVKRGGGNQTNSLRLENEEGRQFTMRSVKKDPSRTVSSSFRNSLVTDILQDNFSAAHPLAALVIPPLAQSIGVYYTNPKIYYVPKQPRLNFYNQDFGNELYLVEERPDDDKWEDAPNFGSPKDIISSVKVVEEVLENGEDKVDQAFVARNRLFDNIIGDWDRHDDQWRWSEFKENGSKVFRPIPRDRDQAFSRYDGAIVKSIRQFDPSLRPLMEYDHNLDGIQWANYGARNFDPFFLNELSWQEWEKEALYIKENLTDEVIERAFKENWPMAFQEIDSEYIISRLKNRRDIIVDIARRMYEYQAKMVDVIGTTDEDYFEIEHLDKGVTVVRIYESNNDGEKKKKYYERIFFGSETNEIRIYGLDDRDFYEIKGNAMLNPRLRLIGGRGKDTYTDNSSKTGKHRSNIIHDQKEGKSTITPGNNTKTKLTKNIDHHVLQRKSKDYEFNYGYAFPVLGINPDDGFQLGALFNFTTFGFKKEPYATQHAIEAKYAFGSGGIQLRYNGKFVDVFGRWDIQINSLVRTALFASNFYGLGNETQNFESEFDNRYHRINERIISFYPALLRQGFNVQWSIGPEFESLRVENTPNRFISTIAEELNPQVFEGVDVFGFKTTLKLKNQNDLAFPTRGFDLDVVAGWKFNLNDSDKDFPYINASVAFVFPLSNSEKIAFATRVGAQQIFNNEFEFFQAATLSGVGPNSNIRGFRRDRFAGQAAFYHNTDIRIQLFKSPFRSIPFVLGAFAGFDYGRVWLEGDSSDTWHTAIGGGLFISPFYQSTISFGLFNGEDDRWLFSLGAGFFF